MYANRYWWGTLSQLTMTCGMIGHEFNEVGIRMGTVCSMVVLQWKLVSTSYIILSNPTTTIQGESYSAKELKASLEVGAQSPDQWRRNHCISQCSSQCCTEHLKIKKRTYDPWACFGPIALFIISNHLQVHTLLPILDHDIVLGVNFFSSLVLHE